MNHAAKASVNDLYKAMVGYRYFGRDTDRFGRVAWNSLVYLQFHCNQQTAFSEKSLLLPLKKVGA